MITMKRNKFPSTDEELHHNIVSLRHKTMNSIKEQGKEASKDLVKNILDPFYTPDIADNFASLKIENSTLEKIFYKNFIEKVIFEIMESEKGDNLYQHSYSTQGIKFDHDKGVYNIVKSKPTATQKLFNFHDLLNFHDEIFISNEQLFGPNDYYREKFGPRDEQTGVSIPLDVISGQNQIRIVDPSTRRYIKDTLIMFCRTKSPYQHKWKKNEFLTGLRPDGKPRNSIDDVLGILSRTSERSNHVKRYVNAIKILMNSENLEKYNKITLKGYTEEGAQQVKQALINQKIDLNVAKFILENNLIIKTDQLQNKNVKYGEMFIPIEYGNHIVHQIYTDRDYTTTEGTKESNHCRYRMKNEIQRVQNSTSWQEYWDEKLTPHFLDHHTEDVFTKLHRHIKNNTELYISEYLN